MSQAASTISITSLRSFSAQAGKPPGRARLRMGKRGQRSLESQCKRLRFQIDRALLLSGAPASASGSTEPSAEASSSSTGPAPAAWPELAPAPAQTEAPALTARTSIWDGADPEADIVSRTRLRARLAWARWEVEQLWVDDGWPESTKGLWQ